MNFSIMGTGFISKKWIKAINELEGSSLISVYDNNITQLNSIKEYIEENNYENTNLKYYDNMNSFHHTIHDILIISTPTYLHLEHAKEMINRCDNIIIEKPLVKEEEDFIPLEMKIENKEMLFSKNKIRLFGVNQRRFSPYVQQAKELISKLKNPYLLQCNVLWNRNEDYFKKSIINQKKEYCFGMLYNQMYHFIDIVRWLGGEIKNINTINKKISDKPIDYEDTSISVLEFENGMLGNMNFSMNCISDNQQTEIRIYAENGEILISNSNLNSICAFIDKKTENINYHNENNFTNYLKEVISAIKEDRESMTDISESIETIKLIERMY